MMDLKSFAGLLEKMAIPAAASAALDAAAATIERHAKDEIGHYQRDAMGPYAPWQELAPGTKAERVRKGFSENEPLLRTGDLRDSIGHTTKGLAAVVGSTSQVMVWQELGTKTIPPRSVLGLAASRDEKAVVEKIGAALVAEMVGGSSFPLRGAAPLLPATDDGTP